MPVVQQVFLYEEGTGQHHGTVKLIHREDGAMLLLLEHVDEEGEETSGANLFLRASEADTFRYEVYNRPGIMRQEAPFPEILKSLVERLEYRAGWTFSLIDVDRGQGSRGLTFQAIGTYPDSYHPETMIRVSHYFIVPAAAYNEASWRRWLLDRLLEVERHEACEFFVIDGERPYAPHHGPGNDPYIVFDHGSDIEARTSFRGDVKPEHPDESNADDDAGAGGC